MAKRRPKKDPIGEMLYLLLVIITLFVYFITKSVHITLIVFLLVFITLSVSGFLYRKWKKDKENNRLRKSGIKEIDRMDGFQFEKYLAALYVSLGYKAEVTKKTGDFGADLLLRKEGKMIVVQAKRYGSNVGLKAVQEIMAAKTYYKADEAWVISNRNYTKQAVELAQTSQVKLVDRDELIKQILKVNKDAIQSPSPSDIRKQNPSEKVVCEKCNGKMIVRSGPRGQFLGCSNFPKCKHTREVNEI